MSPSGAGSAPRSDRDVPMFCAASFWKSLYFFPASRGWPFLIPLGLPMEGPSSTRRMCGELLLRTSCLLLLVGDASGLVVPAHRRAIQNRPRVTPRMEFGEAFYRAPHAAPTAPTIAYQLVSVILYAHPPHRSFNPKLNSPSSSACAPHPSLTGLSSSACAAAAVGYNYAAQYGPQPGDRILPTEGET